MLAEWMVRFGSGDGASCAVVGAGIVPSEVALDDFGKTRMFAPKERNSAVRRCLASVCRLRRAAETAAPAERARRMTKRRPRFAKSRRRTRRRNIGLLERGDDIFIRLGGWGRVRSEWRGEVGERCPEG